jgi:ribosomal protein L37AE/L43A
MSIFKNAARFKRTMENVINGSDVTVNIKENTGSTECPQCGYDIHTRASKIPNCLTCGGKGRVISYTSHNESAIVLWLSSDNMSEQEVGMMTIGDCKIVTRYETKSWWQNCATNKTTLTIDGINVVVKRIIPGLFKEKITAYCARTEL